MPSVTFKAKPQTVYNMDDTPAYRCITVPKITTKHCDMDGFRKHGKFGSYANSDLFPAMLERALLNCGAIGKYSRVLRLDKLPDCVTVDESEFLAKVTISIA